MLKKLATLLEEKKKTPNKIIVKITVKITVKTLPHRPFTRKRQHGAGGKYNPESRRLGSGGGAAGGGRQRERGRQRAGSAAAALRGRASAGAAPPVRGGAGPGRCGPMRPAAARRCPAQPMEGAGRSAAAGGRGAVGGPPPIAAGRRQGNTIMLMVFCSHSRGAGFKRQRPRAGVQRREAGPV